MGSLGDYFDGARSRRRAFSDEQIRELLDAAPTGTIAPANAWRSYFSGHFKPTRRTMQIIGIIGLAASLGMAIHLHDRGGAPATLPSKSVAYQVTYQVAPSPPAPRKAPKVAAPSSRPARRSGGRAGSRAPLPSTKPATADTLSDRGVITEHPAWDSAKVRIQPRDTPMMLPEHLHDFHGSRLIELDAGELRRLGIRVDSVGIAAVWREEGHDATFRLRPDGVDMPDRVEGVDAGVVQPWIITDDVGGMRALIYDGDPADSALEAMMNSGDPRLVQEAGREMAEHASELREAMMKKMERLGTLVPILVRTGREFTLNDSLVLRRHRPDCIFWYAPTPELLALLPADVREEVERELREAEHLVERSREGVSPEENNAAEEHPASIAPGAAPYVDLVRSASGAVTSLAIMPNPAHGMAVLTYGLSRSRTVSITLHDITGRLVRVLAQKTPRDAGAFTTEIDLEGLARGVYLVVIATPDGEQAVQRLVVAE
jgi:hypothetical protein